MRALLVVVLLGAPALARAHDLRVASLELDEPVPGHASITLRAAGQNAIVPVFPAGCDAREVDRRAIPGGTSTRWALTCERALAGASLSVRHDDGDVPVVARARLAGGGEARRVLRPGDAALVLVPGNTAAPARFRSWLTLGAMHVAAGLDHLAFLTGMLLLVRGRRRIALTVTAFTAGHALTLTLAALGVFGLPAAPVEAAVALSILLVATEAASRTAGIEPGSEAQPKRLGERRGGEPPDNSECARPREGSLTRRRPYLVAGGFGLLHGLAFANVLGAAGLPSHDLPVALAGFNLGVELAQLAFVAAALLVSAVVSRLRPPAAVTRALPYALGSLAGFWLIGRVAAFWGGAS